jgi:CheY-like chemotaxis protein
LKEGDCILLVEDSGNDLMLMRYAFAKAGVKHRVSEVRDGQEAIEYLEDVGPCADRDKHPLPCIIITDLKMPRVDGFGFLKWLQDRPEFSRVPKLVLSASGVEKDRLRAAELGACAYFVKPGGLDELVRVIAVIDDDWISARCPLSKAV